MKKIIYILILLVSANGCKKEETEIEKLAHDFEKQLVQKELIAQIDFSKNDSTLIKDIEKQLNIDLCENQIFTGKLNIENLEIKFPAFARKNCLDFTYNRFDNVVSIEINKFNMVLIEDQVISTKEEIVNHVYYVTKDLIKNTSKRKLIFLLRWTEKVNSEKVKKRVVEILFAIKRFRNELANEKYNRNLEELSEEELLKINEEFQALIGFNDDFDPPPPPPRNENL